MDYLVRKSLSHCRNYVRSCVTLRASRNFCSLKEEEHPIAGSAETETTVWPRRVVTGLQPTGALHVGNYFSVVRRIARLQETGERVTVFVADLHACTAAGAGAGAGAGLGERVLDAAAALLAGGVCPERGVVFVQSEVPRHAELCWLLACLAPHARLAALPQWRERSAKGVPRAGVLLYPVLQAADVLLHRGTHVPCGADQLQHLQLAAQLARSFNNNYGPVFPMPQPLLPEDGSDRIRSLRSPDQKMSKSDPDVKSRILLVDDDETITLKLRKAVTDCTPQVTYDPESRPGVSNLIRLHCLATELTPEEAVEESAHLTTAQYKKVVSSALCDALRPVRERAAELRAKPKYLRAVLRHGAARARHHADETYAEAAALVGLR